MSEYYNLEYLIKLFCDIYYNFNYNKSYDIFINNSLHFINEILKPNKINFNILEINYPSLLLNNNKLIEINEKYFSKFMIKTYKYNYCKLFNNFNEEDYKKFLNEVKINYILKYNLIELEYNEIINLYDNIFEDKGKFIKPKLKDKINLTLNLDYNIIKNYLFHCLIKNLPNFINLNIKYFLNENDLNDINKYCKFINIDNNILNPYINVNIYNNENKIIFNKKYLINFIEINNYEDCFNFYISKIYDFLNYRINIYTIINKYLENINIFKIKSNNNLDYCSRGIIQEVSPPGSLTNDFKYESHYYKKLNKKLITLIKIYFCYNKHFNNENINYLYELYDNNIFKKIYNNSIIDLIREIKNNKKFYNYLINNYFSDKQIENNKYIINLLYKIYYDLINCNILHIYLKISFNNNNVIKISKIINEINNLLNLTKKDLNIKYKLKVIIHISGLYLNDNVNLINDNIIIIKNNEKSHCEYEIYNNLNDIKNIINNYINYNNSYETFHKYQNEYYKRYLLLNYEEYKLKHNDLTKIEYKYINHYPYVYYQTYYPTFKLNKIIKKSKFNINEIEKEFSNFDFNISKEEIIKSLFKLLLNEDNKRKLLNVEFINIDTKDEKTYNIDISFKIFTTINKENYNKKLLNIFSNYYFIDINYIQFNIINIINGQFDNLTKY